VVIINHFPVDGRIQPGWSTFMFFAGIDAGSRMIKIVIFDPERLEIVAAGSADQGIEQNALALNLLNTLIDRHCLDTSKIGRIVATGYGRNLIDIADATVTEITCHAAGVRHAVPEARTIVEIGGQDSKLIRLGASGAVQDFMMNDRCAAGTGRFLEVATSRLQLRLEEVSAIAARSTRPAAISSMCVVFAETEMIGLLAGGTPPEDIIAGIQASIASRVGAMAGRRVEAPVVFTGGVATIPGMAAALEKVLGHPVRVAPRPSYTGALGAALLAARQG
jgi:predicted CoA-substrate-specific enzyme activase